MQHTRGIWELRILLFILFFFLVVVLFKRTPFYFFAKKPLEVEVSDYPPSQDSPPDCPICCGEVLFLCQEDHPTAGTENLASSSYDLLLPHSPAPAGWCHSRPSAPRAGSQALAMCLVNI